MHIYLIGFMGAGKTTIGKLLAEELRLDFLDLDDAIEQEAGFSIPEIFKMKGEEFFRQLESKALQSISSSPAKVIATGGGAVLAETNRLVMKNSGISIYLNWPVDVLFDRIRHSQNRPLLRNPSKENLFDYIQKMLNERQPLYELADYIVDGDEQITQEQSVAMILEKLPADDMTKK